MASPRDLLTQAKAQIKETITRRGRGRAREGHALGRPRAGRERAGCHPGFDPPSARQPRVPGRGEAPRQAGSDRRVLRRRCPLGVRGADDAGDRVHRRRRRWSAASTAGRTRAANGSTPKTLTPEQRNRYHRHLLLPEVGDTGQLKLLDSKVLLLGAGGLGSPAALYLAAAGVGTIGIIDMDVVDSSNLQRQILHNLDRIGDRKVDSAKKTLTAMNPDVNVVTYDVRLGADNVLDIISGYDVIVDGTDNFPTRYLVNDASLIARVPVVHGSIFRFEGQVTVFDPYNGPCYRCLIPEPPPAELAPSCAEAGVLGVLPGIIGSIQALEAIKILLGLGDPLVGRLLSFDALEESFRTFKVRRDPACPACGPDAGEIVIAEYDELCMPHSVGAVASA